MNETRINGSARVGAVRLLLVLCCAAVLSGCATTYRICLPSVLECSTVKSYRKISGLSVQVTPEGGIKIEMQDVDRQSDGALEKAAADVIRAVGIPQ